MVRYLLLFAFVLGACGTPNSKDDPAAKTDPALEKCIEDCVRANQMKATAIEQINADCRKGCTGPPKPLKN